MRIHSSSCGSEEPLKHWGPVRSRRGLTSPRCKRGLPELQVQEQSSRPTRLHPELCSHQAGKLKRPLVSPRLKALLLPHVPPSFPRAYSISRAATAWLTPTA